MRTENSDWRAGSPAAGCGTTRIAGSGRAAALVAEAGIQAGEKILRTSWLYYAWPSIVSYLDRPRPLWQLQQDAAAPKAGYDIHHIVERASALRDGYPESRVDASDNLVRIPRIRHWEVTGWYARRTYRYDQISPREYLRGKGWDERRRVGLEALVRYGVLRQ